MKNNQKKSKNMKGLAACFVACLAFVLISQTANAQNKWSAEIRSGANFATQNLGTTNLNTGFGFEGSVAYRFLPHLAAYGGWSWNRFSAATSATAGNVDFEETGYLFGLQFIHPIATSRINYMVRAGGTYNHIETENAAGDIINDTGHGLGWQAGLGFAFPLGNRVQLIPEVRYRSLSRDMKTDNVSTPVSLNYISTSLGLAFSF